MNTKNILILSIIFTFAIGLYAAPSAFAEHSMNATVENADGSSVPGCEPDCFIPATVTIGVGGQVTFANNDTAAHTSTAGTPADGPSGAWDSSLVMTGQSYTTGPLEEGEYPYFCMVHPWMEGLVIVEEPELIVEEPEPIVEEPEPIVEEPISGTFSAVTIPPIAEYGWGSNNDVCIKAENYPSEAVYLELVTTTPSGSHQDKPITAPDGSTTYIQTSIGTYFDFVGVCFNFDFTPEGDYRWIAMDKHEAEYRPLASSQFYDSMMAWSTPVTIIDSSNSSFQITSEQTSIERDSYITAQVTYQNVERTADVKILTPDGVEHTTGSFSTVAYPEGKELTVYGDHGALYPFSSFKLVVDDGVTRGELEFQIIGGPLDSYIATSDAFTASAYLNSSSPTGRTLMISAPPLISGGTIYPIQITDPTGRIPEICGNSWSPGCGIAGIGLESGRITYFPIPENWNAGTYQIVDQMNLMSYNPKPCPSDICFEPISVTIPELPSQIKFQVVHATGSAIPGCEQNNNCFIPYSIKISKGDIVEWTNTDTAPHIAISGTASNGPDGIFDSSLMMPGDSFSFTFSDEGDYDYFCIIHPWMSGKIIVEGDN